MSEQDDATTAALRRLVEDGSDLHRPMQMDFFVAVPNEAVGHAVASRVAPFGFLTSVERDQDTGKWTCYCTKTIVPQYSTVVNIEKQLDRIAGELGGYADGFGSFGNAALDESK